MESTNRHRYRPQRRLRRSCSRYRLPRVWHLRAPVTRLHRMRRAILRAPACLQPPSALRRQLSRLARGAAFSVAYPATTCPSRDGDAGGAGDAASAKPPPVRTRCRPGRSQRTCLQRSSVFENGIMRRLYRVPRALMTVLVQWTFKLCGCERSSGPEIRRCGVGERARADLSVWRWREEAIVV